MIRVPGGTFTMGSDHHYPEERPAHPAEVAAFELAEAPVTVAQFAAFVDATHWATLAEQDPGHGAPPGSAVFRPTEGPVDLSDPLQWWTWGAGVTWRDGPPDHPVVHVALADALAYCDWAGVRLPTEQEWEWAAQGARPGNVWQGAFPWRREGLGTTSPVGVFAANPLGLVDQLGNVWEWTSTPWTSSHQASTCCAPGGTGPAHVAKGGSFLCAPEYCARYRPAARMAMQVDSPTCHLGFRVAR